MHGVLLERDCASSKPKDARGDENSPGMEPDSCKSSMGKHACPAVTKAPTRRSKDCYQQIGSTKSAENCRVECGDDQSESEKLTTAAMEREDPGGELIDQLPWITGKHVVYV